MARFNYDEILDRLLKRMQADTEVVDVDPGTIARAFCEILAEEYILFYEELDMNVTLGFVSSATGQFLDLIGVLLGCTRLTNETDNNFRVRITNQVFALAGGNIIAIRLGVLSIPGVRDVVTKEFTKGTGSFSIYVITDDVQTPQDILNKAEDVVEKTKSFGVYAQVKAPVLIPIDLKVRLVFSDNISDAEKSTIRQKAKQNVKTYIDNIGLGGNFSINEALRNSSGASNKIVDSEALVMRIKDITQFAKNFSTNWDERIVVGSLDVI